MAVTVTSKQTVVRDHKYVEQMAQSIVDVFEVGTEQGIDQSNIAKALDLLGDPTAKDTVWYEPAPND